MSSSATKLLLPTSLAMRSAQYNSQTSFAAIAWASTNHCIPNMLQQMLVVFIIKCITCSLSRCSLLMHGEAWQYIELGYCSFNKVNRTEKQSSSPTNYTYNWSYITTLQLWLWQVRVILKVNVCCGRLYGIQEACVHILTAAVIRVYCVCSSCVYVRMSQTVSCLPFIHLSLSHLLPS